MSLSGYDLRNSGKGSRGDKRRRRMLWRKRKPRDLRIAGFLVYCLLLWLVFRLPQADLSRWFASW